METGDNDVTPLETTTAAGTLELVVIVWPWALVVVMGTTTLVDAAAMAELVETTTEPVASVDEIVTGMTTGVEEVDGGGSGVVFSEFDVVAEVETFCLLIRL